MTQIRGTRTPLRRFGLGRDAHIENSAEAQAFRRAAIAGMKQAQEARIQEAYAKWKREKDSVGFAQGEKR
jgi:hypothetical protein